MKIKQAGYQDIDIISELMLEYGRYETSVDKEVKCPSLNDIKKQEKKHMNLGTIYLLLEDKGVIQGLLDINVEKRGKENIGVLHTLIITKDGRGKGYGNSLVKYALNYFKKKNCKRIRTFVHFKNKGAYAFWKKQGFDFELGYFATRRIG